MSTSIATTSIIILCTSWFSFHCHSAKKFEPLKSSGTLMCKTIAYLPHESEDRTLNDTHIVNLDFSFLRCALDGIFELETSSHDTKGIQAIIDSICTSESKVFQDHWRKKAILIQWLLAIFQLPPWVTAMLLWWCWKYETVLKRGKRMWVNSITIFMFIRVSEVCFESLDSFRSVFTITINIILELIEWILFLTQTGFLPVHLLYHTLRPASIITRKCTHEVCESCRKPFCCVPNMNDMCWTLKLPGFGASSYIRSPGCSLSLLFRFDCRNQPSQNILLFHSNILFFVVQVFFVSGVHHSKFSYLWNVLSMIKWLNFSSLRIIIEWAFDKMQKNSWYRPKSNLTKPYIKDSNDFVSGFSSAPKSNKQLTRTKSSNNYTIWYFFYVGSIIITVSVTNPILSSPQYAHPTRR